MTTPVRLSLAVLFLMGSCAASCQNNTLRSKALALEKKDPTEFYEEAAKEFGAGKKNDAAFLFYLGQLRVRYYVVATKIDTDFQMREAYGAAQAVVGAPINEYLGHDLNNWIHVIDLVLKWEKQNDNKYYSKQKNPIAYKEIVDGLYDLREKLIYVKTQKKDISYFAYLPGFNFKLFDKTTLAPVAKAVEYERIRELDSLIKNDSVNINGTDPKFGNTLLMFAVVNGRYEAVKKLLELGADPNKYDTSGETSPAVALLEYSHNVCDTMMMKLLLEHGGNVNMGRRQRKDKNSPVEYPEESLLSFACGGFGAHNCLGMIKLLVNRGADINSCPLGSAVIHRNLAAVKYLIIDKGARVPPYCERWEDPKTKELKERTLTDILNDQDYSNDPDNAKIRKELLTYMQKKGLK